MYKSPLGIFFDLLRKAGVFQDNTISNIFWITIIIGVFIWIILTEIFMIRKKYKFKKLNLKYPPFNTIFIINTIFFIIWICSLLALLAFDLYLISLSEGMRSVATWGILFYAITAFGTTCISVITTIISNCITVSYKLPKRNKIDKF